MKFHIKVLHVLLDDRIGGSHSRIFSLSPELKKEGIEYILAMPDKGGEAHKYAKEIGLNLYKCELCTPHFVKDFKDFLLNIEYIYKFIPSVCSLIRVIKLEKVDIVHLNDIICIQGAIAALFTRKPVVWHLLGTLYTSFFIKLMRPFIKFSVDEIVNVSKATRDYYLKDLFIKERIIYEPVNLEKFNPNLIPDEKIEKLKKDLGIRDEEITIGAVGNLTWVKGYENLIEAIAIVSKKYKNIKLLIAGKILDTQIEYFKRLKKLASSFGLNKKINFLGWRTDTPEILSLMDIFVLPSKMEGTPISILEAMSMSIPVIACDVGGVHEQIIDGETGILVSPNEPSEIALAILNLLESSKKRKEMGDKAREFARKKFSIGSCVRAHKKLYREVLGL